MPVTYVAIGPNVWGKGPSVKEAKSRMAAENGHRMPPVYYVKRVYDFRSVDPVDGSINYGDRDNPVDPPVFVEYKRPGKRAVVCNPPVEHIEWK